MRIAFQMWHTPISPLMTSEVLPRSPSGVPAISDHRHPWRTISRAVCRPQTGRTPPGVVESVRSRNEIAVELGLTHRFAISFV